MPNVSRITDACTGHGCFPPRPATGASGDVYAEGLAVHRKGDAWAAHGCATCPPHGGALANGSGTVFANGKQLSRIGDPVDCGSSVAAGAATVFAGG